MHGVYFSNGGARLWAATDGGVSRSDRHQDGAAGAPPTSAAFYPRNEGLQVVESNYVAHNPSNEGYVAAGLQDNGSVLRLSSSVWKRGAAHVGRRRRPAAAAASTRSTGSAST